MSDLVNVGASDVPAILGLSPWQAPGVAWARLTGLVPRYDRDVNNAVRRGRVIEPALLAEWCRMARPVHAEPGPTIDEPPKIVDGWRSARADMLAELEGGARLVVEAKTTRRWDAWGPDGTDAVPVYYAAQVAWQLSVYDIDEAVVVAYCPTDDDIRCYQLRRNRGVEQRIIGRVRSWMERHVWCADPEPPDALPWSVVVAQYGEGGERAEWIEPEAEDRAVARELAQVRADKAALEQREEALKARLCAKIGDAYGLKGLCTWGKVKPRETVNAAELRAGWPEVYAQVAQRGSASRQFRLTLKES